MWFFRNDYLRKSIPSQFKAAKYMCIECGNDMSLYSLQCHNPKCKSKQSDDVDVSKNIGLSVLNCIRKNHKDSIADASSNELQQELNQAIIDALPIVDDKDTNVLLPKMYISSFSGNPIIDESLCSRIIDYYCEQFNKLEFQYISSVEVRDLFGYHSYNINLTQDLSVLYGANGLGKTTLLRIIECIFSRVMPASDDEDNAKITENISYLLKIPFKSVTIRFRSGESVKLRRYRYNNVINVSVSIKYHHDYKDKEYSVHGINNENILTSGKNQFQKLYRKIGLLFPDVSSKNKFLFVPVNRVNNIKDIKGKFVNYIKTHQNVDFNESKNVESLFSRITVPAFYTYFQKELGELIHSAEKHFNALFPISKQMNCYEGLFGFEDYAAFFNEEQKSDEQKIDEFVSSYSTQRIDIVELGNLYKKIVSIPRNYQKISNLGYDDILQIAKNKQKQEYKMQMLRIIAPSAWFSLRQIANFYKKYKLFKDLFEGFYYEKDPSRKKIVYERYLHLKSNSSLSFSYDKDMDFDKLSSGEINLATILYYLVFKAGNGAIVLIDEPEVSLHIAWQEQLIDAIKKILEFHDGMQVIIASHSPFLTVGNEEFFVDADLIIGGESNEK